VSDSGTIARLAAKALILELQHSKLPSSNKKSGSRQARFELQMEEEREKSLNDEKEERKKRITELSLKYTILSPYTAFVGIEKRANGNNDEMVLREVPIEISIDDQHLASSLFTHTFGSSAQYSSFHLPMACCAMPSYNLMNDSCLDACMMTNYSLDNLSDCSDCSDDQPAATIVEEKKEAFPAVDQDIVRYLIGKQEFDGLWNLDSKEIEQLTGKPLSHFQQSTNTQLLISVIVVSVLETRFTSFSSMWHGIVQKARKRLLDLLGNDNKKLNTLFEDIRNQL
jgi:hypothetical protein